MIWRLRTRLIDLSPRPAVMGILNVTPDSFSDGDLAGMDPAAAIARGLAMSEAGADIVDVGGESTRPYATPVSVDEELARVVPVVAGLANAGVVVSVDTMKPAVATAALDAGAEIVNDVSGFRDPAMIQVAASSGAGVVVMHMRGTPLDMQDDPAYDDVVAEVSAYLARQTEALVAAGVDEQRIVVDPGIGFGKTHDHNLALLGGLGRLAAAGRPVLVGVSRKGTVGAVLEQAGISTTAAERDVASAALAALAVRGGAAVVRAHDVAMTLEAVAVATAIVRAASGETSQDPEVS